MEATSPEVSIIVVSYNTKQLTLECLRSVFQETICTTFEIIVLDNASSDQSASAIAKEFQNNVQFIPLESNIGFAGGNNYASKVASGKYLLLLNPDTVILEGAIDKLVTFAKSNPDAGIWGGRTLFGDKTLNPGSCWRQQTLWGLTSKALGLSSLFRRSTLFNPEGMGSWDREGIRKVDIVSGCFLLINHDLWKQLNGFLSDFFMYGEEADLCLRAKKLGARPMVTSEATIIHYGGASEKIRSDKLVRLIKAKMLLIRKHFSPYSMPLGIALLACWPLSRYIAHSIAVIFRKNGSSQSKQVWEEVSERRKEWLAQ